MNSWIFIIIIAFLSMTQIAQSSQRILTAASGGGGGARGGGSVSSGSRPASGSSTPSRASSTPSRVVTSASQSRYSSGLSKYRGPVGATNLKPGSRAVFVPTGNNYYLWFLLTDNDVEEYGDETMFPSIRTTCHPDALWRTPLPYPRTARRRTTSNTYNKLTCTR